MASGNKDNMEYTRNGKTITIEMPFYRLVAMASMGINVWATPTTSGHIARLYLGTRAAFQDDLVAAHPTDFESGGMQFDGSWQDLTPEQLDFVRDDVYSCTIPDAVPVRGKEG